MTNKDKADTFIIIFITIVVFLLGVSIGLIRGERTTHSEYCHSLEYDKASKINNDYYCIDNDSPETIFYISWQE